MTLTDQLAPGLVPAKAGTIRESPERAPMPDFGLDLAVIGNGRTAALLEPSSRIVWWCYPRFDADPVFCRLLAGNEEKGFTDVLLDGMVDFQSEYVRNTAIVQTVLTDSQGNAVRITDFAPRFRNFDRTFRPPQLFRMIEPIAGLPRVTIRFRPTHDYGDLVDQHSVGSNHIRYWGGGSVVRLTTDAPLSFIEREAPFALTRPVHMVFGTDEPFPGELAGTCREFFNRTRDYWRDWIRRLAIAYDWQDAVIRAAITLKLSNFEETGGIVAAHTTSIPEAPGSSRTWDYRFCWLRDAYFVVKALNRLGATQTMEDFISFILGIASAAHGGELRPVYGIVPTDPLDEWTAPRLAGYRGDGPVRVGNAAVEQTQHDSYGSIILAAMPMFFDRRLPRPGDQGLFRLLEGLGAMAQKVAFEPDAGIWEYRGRSSVHTHSSAMCWAGCHRLAAIASHLNLPDRAAHWNAAADSIHDRLLAEAWNPKRRAFTAGFGSDHLDASVLLLPDIGLIEPDDPRFVDTVAAMERELLREKHVMRYANADDFGMPETAFLICRFWLVDAWWSLGRRQEARDLFLDALNHRNRYGLLSEDVHPETGALWGNFPQTYSMAGLILTAMRLSRSWEDRYWRGWS
jgi:GH15 family glucan-1,4-alpha-glucosidase